MQTIILKRLTLIFLIIQCTVVFLGFAQQKIFVRPGLLNNAKELVQIKSEIRTGNPVRTVGYMDLLKKADYIQQYKFHHLDTVFANRGRKDPDSSRIYLIKDGEAAYYNALFWLCTGDEIYAQHSIDILNERSKNYKTIVGDDSILATSYAWPQYIWAAEIILYTSTLWQTSDQKKFESLLIQKVAPIGTKIRYKSFQSNWTSWALCLQMSISIYTSNQIMFEEACRESKKQIMYYIEKNGKPGEICRDLWHSQMGIVPLIAIAEMAWKQGVDLYGYEGNRLLKGIEYLAPFLLGELEHWPCTEAPKALEYGCWPGYEMAFNHYKLRKNMEVPMLVKLMGKNRPEKFDRIGLGTLTHLGLK